MSKINTVLFDFDGTLMNTNELIYNSWQHTFRTIKGTEGDPDMIKRSYGDILAKTIAEFFPDYPQEEAIEIYRSYQVGRFSDDIYPFPGMLELVRELKEKGYKVAVVTSRLRNTTLEGLNKYGLDEIVDAVITADECKAHKPEPEPALMAMRAMGSRAEETVMVGDSKYDIGCANNAGVTSVLVDWAVAIYDREQEGIFKPDYTIAEAEDLWGIIDNINEAKKTGFSCL